MKYYFISSTKFTRKGKRKQRFALSKSPDKMSCILGYIDGEQTHIDFVTEISKSEYKRGMKYALKRFRLVKRFTK